MFVCLSCKCLEFCCFYWSLFSLLVLVCGLFGPKSFVSSLFLSALSLFLSGLSLVLPSTLKSDGHMFSVFGLLQVTHSMSLPFCPHHFPHLFLSLSLSFSPHPSPYFSLYLPPPPSFFISVLSIAIPPLILLLLPNVFLSLPFFSFSVFSKWSEAPLSFLQSGNVDLWSYGKIKLIRVTGIPTAQVSIVWLGLVTSAVYASSVSPLGLPPHCLSLAEVWAEGWGLGQVPGG